MAAVFRDFARKGFTEGMSGHISVRDPEFPNAIWMNPLGRHFGLMTAGDLMCLDLQTGAVVGGNKVSYASLHIRSPDDICSDIYSYFAWSGVLPMVGWKHYLNTR